MARAWACLAAILLVSCAQPERRAYLVADRAVVAGMGGTQVLEAIFRAAAESRGYAATLSVASKDTDLGASLDKASADPISAVIVCLSAVPLDLSPWESAHGGTLFAGYGVDPASGPRPQPKNDLRLVPGRVDAYRVAGEKLGELVGAGGEPHAVTVGILAVSPTKVASAEIDSFRAGLASTGVKDPLYRESRSLTDKAALLRELRDMRDAGARYFLLKTYGLTAACLEAVEQEGDHAVVEDCGPRGCGGSVILSIETDWAKTMSAVMTAAGAGGWTTQTLTESSSVRVWSVTPPR